jgi:hypothetical protein
MWFIPSAFLSLQILPSTSSVSAVTPFHPHPSIHPSMHLSIVEGTVLFAAKTMEVLHGCNDDTWFEIPHKIVSL